MPRGWGPVTPFKMAAMLATILDFSENEKSLKNVKNWNFLMLDM